MEDFRDIVAVLGAALITLGIGLVYPPAGAIAAGTLMIVFAALDGYDDRNDNDEGSEDAR